MKSGVITTELIAPRAKASKGSSGPDPAGAQADYPLPGTHGEMNRVQVQNQLVRRRCSCIPGGGWLSWGSSSAYGRTQGWGLTRRVQVSPYSPWSMSLCFLACHHSLFFFPFTLMTDSKVVASESMHMCRTVVHRCACTLSVGAGVCARETARQASCVLSLPHLAPFESSQCARMDTNNK